MNHKGPEQKPLESLILNKSAGGCRQCRQNQRNRPEESTGGTDRGNRPGRKGNDAGGVSGHVTRSAGGAPITAFLDAS